MDFLVKWFEVTSCLIRFFYFIFFVCWGRVFVEFEVFGLELFEGSGEGLLVHI